MRDGPRKRAPTRPHQLQVKKSLQGLLDLQCQWGPGSARSLGTVRLLCTRPRAPPEEQRTVPSERADRPRPSGAGGGAAQHILTDARSWARAAAHAKGGRRADFSAARVGARAWMAHVLDHPCTCRSTVAPLQVLRATCMPPRRRVHRRRRRGLYRTCRAGASGDRHETAPGARTTLRLELSRRGSG